MTENGQRCRVAIHGSAVEDAKSLEEFGPDFVVGRLKALQRFFIETPEERPQCIAVRGFGETQDRRDQAVVQQGLGIFDAADTGNDGEQVRQKKIAGVALSVMVAWPANMVLQEMPQTQRFAKLHKKADSSPASQAGFLEEKLEFSQPFWHSPQTYHFDTFVREAFYL